MTLLPLIILAVIQGLTEFLPVSSSGHLVLVHGFLGGEKEWDERVILDVAVHVGTLFSVLLYFWRDVWAMIKGALSWLEGDFKHEGGHLAFYVLIASIPVILAGLALHIIKPSWLDLVEVMAWSTIVFGILLWWADQQEVRYERIEDLTLKHAFLIGLAQCLALIPGTSRSGITMTAARVLGYSRTRAAQFSLLLAIVAISGAGTLAGKTLYDSGDVILGLDALIAVGLAFVFGWASIAVMMKWLERSSFTVFAVYRVILGVVLLIAIYGGFIVFE